MASVISGSKTRSRAAKGSCGEFATQALIGMEIGYIAEQKGTQWRNEAIQLSRMLGALLNALASGQVKHKS